MFVPCDWCSEDLMRYNWGKDAHQCFSNPNLKTKNTNVCKFSCELQFGLTDKCLESWKL